MRCQKTYRMLLHTAAQLAQTKTYNNDIFLLKVFISQALS